MSNAEMLIHAFMTSGLDYCNALLQGFSKSTFTGPNLNFHQYQRSGTEQLVITKLVFNKHTVAYITCITNKHSLDFEEFFSGRCDI